MRWIASTAPREMPRASRALYEAYRRAPDVTRRRMYLETMAKVLPRMGTKLYMDKDAQGVLPILPLETLRGLTGDPRGEQ